MTAGASFPALGGTAIVATTDAASLSRAERVVREEVAALDLACSRFREDSELTRLNEAAGTEVQVGGLLFHAVCCALRAAELTDGAVDPTIGQTLIALGYDRDFDEIADGAGASFSFAAVPGWRAVTVDPARRAVRLPVGVRLDLGATAKALGADLAAQRAQREAGCGVLVGLSGDIAIAGPAPPGGWRIRVTDDHRAGTEAPGQWITLRSGGLATSSTTARCWHARGETLHHLIDPATARSASGPWRTVSVAAASCLEANIASTAAVIRGAEALDWLEALGLPSRLVAHDAVAIHLAGWPADGDDLAPATPHPVDRITAPCP